ncbi:MAG: D-sedoheptulose 7-phosphate isomerase [Bacteroidetes bacterium]|nr:MAG: D-sedoheptulose 7-phosphate isomerase [Bacteroidota bacterium]
MNPRIAIIIQDSIRVHQALLQDEALVLTLERVAQTCVETIQNGGKILFCGNGGSAADAQHLAAELSGRFYWDRDPLPAEALHTNVSFLTAVGNDYGFEDVFARAVIATGKEGDVLFALSTSGKSKNILHAMETARQRGLKVVGMSGESGGKMAAHADYLLKVPSTDTPRIQECHLLLGHIICELVEVGLFGQ